MTNPDQQERELVFTMPESRIFHKRRDCPSLRRSNRYWPVTETTRAEAARRYYAKTQPCKLCAS